MPTTIEVYDERPGRVAEFCRRFNLQLTHTTAAEIIRLRVTAEVDAINATSAGIATSSEVVVGEAEATLNGCRRAFGPKLQLLDVEAEVDKALAAFSRNAFFMFVDDRQVTSLDERIDPSGPVRATFFRLVPLVGG